ncbi:polysaccharide biosynthesis/export family protein [Thalassospira alkalitolerans]|nr:polysaccharide biosynthesis/export family protein [Thalassospira alkalitolerans]|tara:strand:+ start:193170 stop:193721 length:552 start_codon:yes stop_codon:yes gene_type:complete
MKHGFSPAIGMFLPLWLLLILLVPGAIAHAQTIYTIDSGDELRITVFEENDLTGDFPVGSDGTITLPLAGKIELRDLTLQAAQNRITNTLAQGFLRHPVVSLEVIHFRPFYILGEVNDPGQYDYVSGMNILNAVALGGGFTYRADQDDIVILRGREDNRIKLPAAPNSIVLPGDIIRVTERYF